MREPNILWIVADDLGTDLGCYGESNAYTPNIDKFASEGTMYTNFFTVTAVCSPSRSALITGMYPSSINSHQHRTQYKLPLPEGMFPITKYFRNAGYFTSNGSFESREKQGKEDYNFTADSLFDGTDWSQRKEGQPFFSQVQIFFPHRPFKRDPENPVDEKKIKLPPYYPDHRVARQDWALYLEYIQLLDKEVGKVLKRLDDEGLTDSTIVFFFGDQGRPHVRAKQFLYDGGINTPLIVKGEGFEKGIVSDILISNIDLGPTALAIAGIYVPEYIQGRDFLPVGDERAYVFAMRDRRDETVDRIRAVRSKDYKYIKNFYPEKPYTQFNAYKKQAYPTLTLMQVLQKQGKLTSEQLLFMASERPLEELYDLNNDPFELNNLSGDSEYRDKMEEMRSIMEAWLQEVDKGTYPEDPAEIKFAEELMESRFREQMEAKGLTPDVSDEEFLQYWEEYLTPTIKKE
ncbi:MAG: sulfatase [Bacteroidetes bacterium]|nr:sulfatase [Bacteroidota bacterium]